MTIEQEYGLNAGLNKLKIGRFIKRNLKSATKDIGKVAKFVTPIASTILPVVAPIGGGVASKLLNSKVGKLATKVTKSKTGKTIGKGIKIVKAVKKSSAKPVTKASNVQFPLLRPSYTENLQPVAQPVATTSVRLADNEFQTENFTELPGTIEPSPIPTQTKDNTLLYVGGAAAIGVAIYFATKKSN